MEKFNLIAIYANGSESFNFTVNAKTFAAACLEVEKRHIKGQVKAEIVGFKKSV